MKASVTTKHLTYL
ncbi:unnamed protein product, partial [Vitis vinifera]|uniref:Uncharacterized protein n=1 Tax=Vitis vinifera TaxID=29760 RepID=D7TMK4_VITVI